MTRKTWTVALNEDDLPSKSLAVRTFFVESHRQYIKRSYEIEEIIRYDIDVDAFGNCWLGDVCKYLDVRDGDFEDYPMSFNQEMLRKLPKGIFKKMSSILKNCNIPTDCVPKPFVQFWRNLRFAPSESMKLPPIRGKENSC